MNEESRHARTSLLYEELRWMMHLRWIAAGALVCVGMADWRWTKWFEHSQQIVALGTAVAAFNTAVWLVDRARPGVHSRWPAVLIFATIQLYTDLVALTLLAVWTGGMSSGVLSLFFLHMIFASLLQPRAMAYLAAFASAVMVGCGCWLSGRLPSSPNEAALMAGWSASMIGVVYLSNRISRGLYRRELQRVRQSRRLRAALSRLRKQHEALVQHEKLVAMGQLAAGLAHEITNPLSNMDSLLQLMQRNPGTPRPEAAAMLRDQIRRIHRTVNQLTQFAHPGKGQFEVMRLNEVVQTSLDMLSLDRRMKQVHLETGLSEESGSARINRHALEQVLTNLFRNALDAMAGVQTPRLEVRTNRRNGECSILVSDNGAGIPRDKIMHIFDPFFTTKPVGQGTGLGLSISASLVEEHGGRLEVESEPGRGTTFAIRIPVTETEQHP